MIVMTIKSGGAEWKETYHDDDCGRSFMTKRMFYWIDRGGSVEILNAGR